MVDIHELEAILAQEEYEEMWNNIDHKRLDERDALHKEIIELSRKPRYTIAEQAQRLSDETFIPVDYSELDRLVFMTYTGMVAFWLMLGGLFMLGIIGVL